MNLIQKNIKNEINTPVFKDILFTYKEKKYYYSKIKKLLLAYSEKNNCEIRTYQDIIDLDIHKISQFYGAGKTKIELISKWKLDILSNPIFNYSWDKSNLRKLKFNYVNLSSIQKKVINKLKRQILKTKCSKKITVKTLKKADEITPFFIFEELEIKELKAIGKQSINAIQSLRKEIEDVLRLNKSSKKIIITSSNDNFLSFKKMLEIINEEIFLFRNSLNNNKKRIFDKRFGYKSTDDEVKQLSLDALGKEAGVTRERIRQKEVMIVQELIESISISSESIKEITLKTSNDDIIKYFQNNFGYLYIESTRLFALISNIDKNKLEKILFPKFSADFLDSFFMTTPFPITYDQIINHLIETENISEFEANYNLEILKNNNFCKCIKDKNSNIIIPNLRSKEVGLCHFLIGYPNGLPWKELQEKVNSIPNITKSSLYENRPESALNTSNYIYLSQAGKRGNGRSTSIYKHKEYFNIPNNIIDKILKQIKLLLSKNINYSFNLKHEIYPKLKKIILKNEPTINELDYMEIRHICRDYGYRENIFFNGKSSSDTVSLKTINKQVTVGELIVKEIKSQPLGFDDLVSKFKINKEYIYQYLMKNMHVGKIIKNEEDKYEYTNKYFKNDNILGAKKELKKILFNDQRIHHAGILIIKLRPYFNNYDLNLTKCINFIISQSKDNWHVQYHGNKSCYVSYTPINDSTLSNFVKKRLHLREKDLLSEVNQKYSVHYTVIKRAYYNVKNL